ncbi:protein PALS1 isoform X1 [Centruroides vittatus]|uniref:protein PALS1 isoform X1 n=2 Tax=Centruroides vittatus TaxID=120091 RepID=UPI003510C54A
MVDLGGYVIILVETTDKKIKLYGSPADRADLEVGDEILEVNGRTLENCTHTEVISHIHQCIRSRTICLRVKRKTGTKLALDLAQNVHVQDAFVIAVEQQARERLERLSALRKIKPIDMTKLSQELNEYRPQNESDLNGVIENNPVYVTSVPEIQSATLERVKKDKLKRRKSSGSGQSIPAASNANGPQGDSAPIEQEPHDQELELKQEILDEDKAREDLRLVSYNSSPKKRVQDQSEIEGAQPDFSLLTYSSSPKKRPLSGPQRSTEEEEEDSREFPVIENSSSSSEDFSLLTYSSSPRKRPVSGDTTQPSSSSISESVTYREQKEQPVTKVNNIDKLTDRASKCLVGEEQIKDTADRIVHSMEGIGTLREMAVDVPDSFVAVAKAPPRYPPPKPANSPIRTSPVEDCAKSEALNGRLPKQGSEMELKKLDNTEEHLGRIRKYQEDIRKRKEEEERIAKEEEFLRSSLRGSKKLQALESKPPRTGIVNTAFELEEGDSGIHPTGKSADRLVGDVVEGGRPQPPELKRLVGVSELLHSLSRIKSHYSNNGHKNEDLSAIESLLNNKTFQKVLDVHNKVQEICCFNAPPVPVCACAQELTQDVINNLQECSLPEASELLDIISKFDFEGLLYSHDSIAERQATPEMTPDEELLDRASHYTHESVKIVRIDKTGDPLGATVKNEGDSVIVGRIVKGANAEKSGLLHVGDEILEVNGVEMRGKSVNDVCDILAGMTGTLTFLVIPSPYEHTKGPPRDVIIHVKAHFDYDPDDDLYIPCRELGISFRKGDVLHVISQDDPNWWQAYREGDEDQALAGLIPSKSFQQQRESMKQTIVGDTNNKEKSKKGRFLCAKKPHKKKKKKLMYNANYNDIDVDQILTYEEVALYYPRANQKRPIVLIGPPNIGRHEIRQRLMEDTEHFAAAVPHTSRPRRDGEVNGVDYHFISRTQFEADIVLGKFVEHGEYEKNYYGTSLDAIRAVVNSGKICVLNLHPQSLKILKYSDLKPYVVFVAPPSLEKLRQNRIKSGATVKDEELKDIIEKAREMEENYGHFFDMIIINSDTDKTYNELLHEINILDTEPQWVPGIWLKDTN